MEMESSTTRKPKKGAPKHVYKSGAAGCGGKAAPSTAKNSGQVLPCPYCDRNFKQDGRLKEHLKNQHSSETQDQDESTDPCLKPALSTSKSDSVEGTRNIHVSPQSSYSVKTPKTLLHEWCQKNRRLTPKFKQVEVDGGFYGRVILPDARNNDADVILWYKDVPMPTMQEAQHRAAVVALHYVMGDRRLDRILPDDYRQQWHNLDREAEEHKARLKANIPIRRHASLYQQEKPSVFMSEDNRRMVEGLLKDDGDEGFVKLKAADQRVGFQDQLSRVNDSKDGQAVSCSEDWENSRYKRADTCPRKGLNEPVNEPKYGSTVIGYDRMKAHLLRMGFQEHYICAAFMEVKELSSALDWLMLHVPEEELPANFAPEASKASVQVLVRGDSEDDSCLQVAKDSLANLQSFGYAISDCIGALAEANGDDELALCNLFYANTGKRGSGKSVDLEESEDQLAELRAEEKLVLESIFGEDMHSLSNSKFIFRIPIRENALTALVMEVRLPSGSCYPFEIPVIALQHENWASNCLLCITSKVADYGLQMIGRPMIYDLVSYTSNVANLIHHDDAGHTCSLVETICSDNPSAGSDIAELEKMSVSAMSVQAPTLGISSVFELEDQDLDRTSTREERQLGGATDFENTEMVNGPMLMRVSSDYSVEQQKSSIADVSLESSRLKEEWDLLRHSAAHAKMRSVRTKLPAFKERGRLLNAVDHSPITLVCGQTGCGKSTQVPQYILEQYIEMGMGAVCNIVCTQPRRLSAIGLADRVARERGQAVGITVGYSVRLESCRSVHTRLLFCTTGVMLRRLLNDSELRGVTHIIVDEVHERTLEIDLLLLLLRERLKRTGSSIRVILMSATVDSTLFSDYFREALHQDVPVVYIPGFTFPVRELYLEDALELTSYKVGRNSRYALKKKPNSANKPESLQAGILTEEMDSWEARADEHAKQNFLHVDKYSEVTIQSLSLIDQSMVNFDLIEALIGVLFLQETEASKKYGPLLADSELKADMRKGGSVLVFLPGMSEIRRLQNRLQSSNYLSSCASGDGLWVLALHGTLSGQDQRRVFVSPPKGIRKVVLATNVAETSITIDDVTYVIDAGRHKEMRYNYSKGLSCLEETWISKANAKQRRGRAGRVRPGCCIRLFSQHQYQQFEEQQLPEVLRVSLEGLCLRVKSLLPGKLEDVLSRMISPPSIEAVGTALKSLQDLVAFDAKENLTPLGRHLAQMPVDARIGKMLIFSCLLKCLDPVLTIAAALSGRTPFTSPIDKREEANALRHNFAGSTKSDHLAVVSAYDGWISARKNGSQAEEEYCRNNFLSKEALGGIEASRFDYLKILADLGFLPWQGKSQIKSNFETSNFNVNSSSVRVVKAVICVGFYPNVARIQHPEKKFSQTEGGTVAKVAAAHEVRFFTKMDGRVFLHPSSVNFPVGFFESSYLIFTEKVRTSKLFLRENTMVPAYGLLLFGGEVQINHEKQIMMVDGWLEFEAPARISVLIRELRAKVDSLLLEKIERPQLDISSSPVVTVLVRLLTRDGF